jgi:hypothetical protein
MMGSQKAYLLTSEKPAGSLCSYVLCGWIAGIILVQLKDFISILAPCPNDTDLLARLSSGVTQVSFLSNIRP